MSGWYLKALAALTLSVLLTGCSLAPAKGALNGLGLNTRAVELTDVPFYPQEEFHCGPAFGHGTGSRWASASPDELASEIFVLADKEACRGE